MKRDDEKEFVVVVQRGTKETALPPIFAKNAEAAKARALRLIRRRGGKATIVGATEKKS